MIFPYFSMKFQSTIFIQLLLAESIIGYCSYDFSDSIQITNFTNLNVNELGRAQGVTGNQSFYTFTFDKNTGSPLDISGYDYFEMIGI